MKIEEWSQPDRNNSASPLKDLSGHQLLAVILDYQEFLAEWLAWAEAGAPEPATFGRREGLCSASFAHGDRKGSPAPQQKKAILFWRFGYDPYPFGEDAFDLALKRRGMHRCPKRLAWVRAELEVLEETLRGERERLKKEAGYED